MMTKSAAAAASYVAGKPGFHYPALGDPLPPGGATVILLTRGNVPVTGVWRSDGGFIAWSPMPRRSDYQFPANGGAAAPRADDLLLLSKGGICLFGPWAEDGRYVGWAPMPARGRDREEALRGSSPRRSA